ncbi:MAG: hypothetical protein ABIO04_13585 [Ferruginibacter sp.]
MNLCIRKDILATLTYFNMFDYPLRKREIFLFLSHHDELHEFEDALGVLLNESMIYKIGEFYSLHNNYSLAERRIKGNEKAVSMLTKAGKAASLIANFPFVTGVAVSGSLSKNFADDAADIDFFIITNANRLWIARTFLHVFKKFTFLLNLQHYFCMNYFIDEAELTIVEKNVYTATEIATLLPLWGNVSFEEFYAANSWTKKFLPNNYMRISSAKDKRRGRAILLIEKLMNNKAGDWIDTFLMKLTAKSWSAKTRKQKINSRGIVMSMDVSKHYSKPNPQNFQQKLLKHYNAHLIDLFDQYEHSSPLTNELL